MEKERFETITKLLDEEYKNVRMASFAIDSIITQIEDKKLEDLLRKQNKMYLDVTTEIEKISKEYAHEPVDINIMLKGMSYASIKTKTLINNDSSKIAQMLIEGTTMGVTQMIQARTENPINDEKILKLSEKIVSMEEDFVESLKEFL